MDLAEKNMSKSNPVHLLSTPFATIFASVATTFLVAYAFFKFAGPVPISINQTSVEKQATFDVAGQGKISTIPDQAEIVLGIRVEKPTIAQAQNETNQKINEITKALKNLGIKEENIKTQDYSIYPAYAYQQEEKSLTGYAVNTNLQVKINDFAILNQAIDKAGKLGANQIGNINFSLSEKVQKKAESKAREQAVGQARQKAKELAALANIKLGRILNLREQTSPPNWPRPMPMAAIEAGEEREPTQIKPGSTELAITITLSYETLP